eukprot:CAMPEP_0171462392 /NCGR_PEP_ID=MMETSP0945-20130129/6444_1 /TAXON_ID=109269 /ORGANISM="Vaucheria litorea, Strain CCMP2940" /LENGTH=119 /DNA_ID=CAMNT_0011988901 /DNA_START=610 /DNA_END=969 /DNA_ORIENTATION=+
MERLGDGEMHPNVESDRKPQWNVQNGDAPKEAPEVNIFFELRNDAAPHASFAVIVGDKRQERQRQRYPPTDAHHRKYSVVPREVLLDDHPVACGGDRCGHEEADQREINVRHSLYEAFD